MRTAGSRGEGHGQPAARPQPCGRNRRRGAGDALGSGRSRRRLEGPRGALSVITGKTKYGDDRVSERGDDLGRLAREAFGQAEAQRWTVRRAVLRSILIGRAAWHGSRHRHRYLKIRAAIASRRRADESRQDAGHNEKGQDQTMRKEPELHGDRSATELLHAKDRLVQDIVNALRSSITRRLPIGRNDVG